MFRENAVLFPRHPLELAGDLKTPVLGLYGGEDDAIAVRSIRAMEERLRVGSPEARASHIYVYPDGPHAFFADYRESYRANLAGDAWARCIAWLGGHSTYAANSA